MSSSASTSQSSNLLGRHDEVNGKVAVVDGGCGLVGFLTDFGIGSPPITNGTDAKEYVSEKTRGISGILPKRPHFCFRAASKSSLGTDVEELDLAVVDEDDIASCGLLTPLLAAGDVGVGILG